MARAIWKGGISFGLVYVPVQVYPATRTQHTGFNLLEKHTIDPIGYKQINKRTGKEVAREDIVRGFEYEKGKYVVLTDEEIRAASPESTQSVDILSFVDAFEVSFLYVDTPYYLAPERRGEKAYALLPDRISAKMGKQNRNQKIFVDYLRNNRGSSTIAAFSARARAGLGVSVPLAWDEVEYTTRGDQWTVANLHERLDALRGGPWAGYAKCRQRITAAMRKRLDRAGNDH